MGEESANDVHFAGLACIVQGSLAPLILSVLVGALAEEERDLWEIVLTGGDV